MLNLRVCCAVVVLMSAVTARAITINTDFFFLLDASGSGGGTDRAIQKRATEPLIEDTIDPSNTGARVGFASFADDVTPGVSLGDAVATDTEDLLAAFDTLAYTSGYTNNGAGVLHALEDFDETFDVDRMRRFSILTDGRPNLQMGMDAHPCVYENALKSSDIAGTVVGIGSNFDPLALD
ncbi:MAG: vWA domain-containing protein, partial [Pseudomonadota bacterium]